jgi:hypothetical protein
MKIFYILSIILLLFIQAKSQERNIPSPGQDPVAKIIRYYPNPAISFITFDFQQTDDKTYSLQIYNFIGKKVHEVSKVTPKTVVDLADFYRGVYIFQLRDKGGKVIESGKFQVSK